jgi:hypothetical protein
MLLFLNNLNIYLMTETDSQTNQSSEKDTLKGWEIPNFLLQDPGGRRSPIQI